MAECELFDLVPNLTWSFWAPLCHDLLDRHVLTYRAGTLIFAHEQVRREVDLGWTTLSVSVVLFVYLPWSSVLHK